MDVFSLIKFNYLNRLSYAVLPCILYCLTKDIIFNIFLTRIVFDERWNLLDYFDTFSSSVHYRLSPLPSQLEKSSVHVYKSRKFASNLFSSTFFLYIHIEPIKNYLSISHLHLSL